jgi:HK97 gp10 family phage protein
MNRYQEVLKKMEEAHRKRNIQMAEDTAEWAKTFAPVKTGALRDSIHVVSNKHTGEARVEVGVPYGVVIEFGGHNRAAHPFMYPAIEHVRRECRHKPLKIDLYR